MRSASDVLCELFRLCAQQHGMLKAFLLANAGLWGDITVRRKARLGLAVVTSMLRRLIHLLAREQVLPPLRVRTAPPTPLPVPETSPSSLPPPPPSMCCQSDAPRRRFRLIETPRTRPRAAPNPDAAPDSPALTHAIFMERLARLADAWRARHRIARRLARRVRGRAAPLRALCLPAQIHAHAPSGVTRFLDALQDWLNDPDTS